MKDFSQIKKNLKKDFSNLKPIIVAILGDTSTQFLTQSIRGIGFDCGLDLQILETDFNQVKQHVFDRNSELYTYNPEIVILFQASHKFLQKFNESNPQSLNFLAKNELEEIVNLVTTFQSQSATKVIFYNYTEIDDAVFGSFSNRTENSFLFQLRSHEQSSNHLN